MNTRNKKFLAVGIVLAAAIILFLQFMPQKAILQGEVVIRQISVSPRIAGRIEEINVKEGDIVKKGDIIAKIFSPDIIAKSHQANAASKAAMAQRDKAEKGTRSEDLSAAKSLFEKAQVGQDLAEKTYNRVKELFDGGVVSAQKLDEAKAQYDAAKKDFAAAGSRYDMAVKGARDEDKKAAEALSEQALGVVSEVKSYVDETELVAPIYGEVSTVVLEKGELVAPGFAVVTLLDLSDMWLSFNVREDFLAGIKLGSVIDVKIPALGKGIYKFKVSYISKLGDFAVWSATKSRGEVDLKTFEVRAVAMDSMPDLRHGMTASFTVRK